MTNFVQLGIEIESKDAVTAANNLDSMAAAGKRAEKATDDLKKSTTDWASEQAKANARAAEMASQEERRANSAKKANSAIKEQKQELARLLGQIDPTVRALDQLDERQKKLAQFRKQGLLGTEDFTRFNKQLQDQRSLLGGVADAQGKAGMSARAYSAAMRNVPAQITDITTSLIAGQPAYLVALQQGGQLKDMFGGIGPAARALSTSLVAMINPVTILAAGVTVLGAAWYQAGKRTESINEALISTGRYAAASADDIKAMATEIDGLKGVTSGAAIDALNRLAAGGRVSAEALQISAEAATRWAAVTGQGADTVIEKFNAIAKDPLDALTKLNETERFLTETQYRRIKALQDEGKWQEAATEAARIYADAVNGRAREIEKNLGLISTAWLNIKSTSSEAWDAMVTGIDRGMGPLQRFADKLAEIGGLSRQASLYGIGLLNPAAALITRFGGSANRGGPEVIMPGVDGETRTPEAVRDEAAANRAKLANDAWRQTLATTDKILAQKIEIERIEDRGKAAGIARADIDKQILAYKKQQADLDAKKGASAARGDISGAQSLIDSANRQIEANKQLSESGEAVSASRRKIIEIDQRLAEAGNLMTATQRAQLAVAKQQLDATDKLAESRRQLIRDTSANLALEERLAASMRQQRDQNEVSLMAIGRGGDAATMAQRQLDIRRDYLKQIDELEKAQRNKNTALSEQELQKEKAMLATNLSERLALEQSFQNARMSMLGDWRNGANAAFEDYAARAADVAGQFKSLFEGAFQGAEDAFVKFVMTGKLSFSDLAKSIIADLARIAAKQAIVGAIGSIVGSIAGGIATNAGNAAVSQGTQNINQQISNDWFSRNGFSNGGYTGDGGKYQSAGTVHKGEVVWSQADVKAVGGPQRANAMRPTAGYANGGIVGGGGSGNMYGTSAPQVTFIMNMQDGTVSTQQQGRGDESTRELKQMFETMITQWWIKNNRNGGAVANARMGTG